MNKTKIRKLRRHIREKTIQEEKTLKLLEQEKKIAAERKKRLKASKKERVEKFFQQRDEEWERLKSHANLAVPSVITNEGTCFRKRSPLDDY